MSKWQSMSRLSISLAQLCYFALLAGCSVDLSSLAAPPHKDAAMSSDAVFFIGDSDGTETEKGLSADAPAAQGRGGAGGSGGAQTGGSTGAGGRVGADGSTATGGSSYLTGRGGSGGALADGADLAVDNPGSGGVEAGVGTALDGAPDIAEDNPPTTHDSGGTDHAADSIEGGGDDVDGAAAAPEVGAADARDLGTDRYEAGAGDQGDAGCRNHDCIPSIVLSFPTAMKCSLDGSTAELTWSDLPTWQPTYDSRLCGNAGAYSVQGSIVEFQPGLQVLADVYAPEDSTWYPISGGPILQPNTAGGFNGYFCLPQKGLERTFRFRIAKPNTSQDAGVACLIHVSR